MNVEGAHTERLSSFDVDEPLDADSGSEGHEIADPRRTSRTNQPIYRRTWFCIPVCGANRTNCNYCVSYKYDNNRRVCGLMSHRLPIKRYNRYIKAGRTRICADCSRTVILFFFSVVRDFLITFLI